MKTKLYPSALFLLLGFFLFFSVDTSAQYGRRHHSRGYYSRGYYSRGYYRPYPVRYYPRRSYYYNRPFVSISFGGVPYRYQYGYFYRPYGSAFRMVVPPLGIRISTLPPGYRSFYVGPDPYYYYQGTYYRSYEGQGYEVVKPPLGAVVNELPAGSEVRVIDGKKFYELDGTYFEEGVDEKGKPVYTVVGTDGVLDTGNEESQVNAEPQVGDRFDDLPADSKEVVIKGEKLYLSPAGLYYKEVKENGDTRYEVVGK